jgi:hypothetical protein
LIRGIFAAPDFRLIRIDPPSFANACRALASLKRTGSRLFVCQGARCPSLTLVRLAVADTIALGGESERASRCRSTARSRKPLSAVRSTVGSNPTPSAAKPISQPGAGDLGIAECARPLTGRVNERQRTSFLASVHSPAIPPAGPFRRAASPTFRCPHERHRVALAATPRDSTRGGAPPDQGASGRRSWHLVARRSGYRSRTVERRERAPGLNQRPLACEARGGWPGEA